MYLLKDFSLYDLSMKETNAKYQKQTDIIGRITRYFLDTTSWTVSRFKTILFLVCSRPENLQSQWGKIKLQGVTQKLEASLEYFLLLKDFLLVYL